MVLDSNLVKFLDMKRKSDNPRNQVTVLEAFECILPNIYNLYLEKLAERDSFDEFQVENCVGGVKFEDGQFYNRYFLPSCILNIYQLWLKSDVNGNDVLEECFSIGSGSATKDLFPEVTGICVKCAAIHFQSFHLKSESEIKQVNINVFEHQKTDKFEIPGQYSVYERRNLNPQQHMNVQQRQIVTQFQEYELENANHSDPVVGDKKPLTNPFEDSDIDEDELFVDSCNICFESFPTEEFVALHKKIFHSVLQTRYVDSPEEMITSFYKDIEKTPSSTAINVKTVQKNRKLRKCLKFK